jgi:hypothetical protein
MATFVKIASTTVGSGGAGSIEFTSIPSTYTDLVLKLSLRTSYSSANREDLKLNFNSNTSNWTDQYFVGTGSAVTANFNGWSGVAGFPGQVNTAITTSNTFTNLEISILNYAGSSGKSWLSDLSEENNAVETRSFLVSGLWNNSAAITSIQVIPFFTAFVQHSTATLYGISNS